MRPDSHESHHPWVAICIPGRLEDGSDSAWFAWNREEHLTVAAAGPAEAAAVVRAYNRESQNSA